MMLPPREWIEEEIKATRANTKQAEKMFKMNSLVLKLLEKEIKKYPLPKEDENNKEEISFVN